MCSCRPHTESSQIPLVELWFWEGRGPGVQLQFSFPSCLVSQDSPGPRGENAQPVAGEGDRLLPPAGEQASSPYLSIFPSAPPQFLLQAVWAKMGYQTGQDSDCHSASPLPLVSSQGPLSVFSTKNRWQLVGPVHMTRGEGGFGFTLRGDSPVLIAAVVPGGQAEVKAPHSLMLGS